MVVTRSQSHSQEVDEEEKAHSTEKVNIPASARRVLRDTPERRRRRESNAENPSDSSKSKKVSTPRRPRPRSLNGTANGEDKGIDNEKGEAGDSEKVTEVVDDDDGNDGDGDEEMSEVSGKVPRDVDGFVEYAFLNSGEVLKGKNAEVLKGTRGGLKELYEMQSKIGQCLYTGSIEELNVEEEVDSSVLWEFLRLRQSGLVDKLESLVEMVEKEQEKDKETEDGVGDEEISGEGDYEDEEGSEQSDESSSEEEETNDEAHDEDPSEFEDDPEEDNTKRVKFALADNEERDSEDEDEVQRKPAGLEDGFFSLAAMEAFADEAEQLAGEGKLVKSDSENAESDDEEPDEEDTCTRRRPGTGSGKSNDGEAVYADFFDAPEDDAKEIARARRRAELFDQSDDSGDEADNDTKTPLQRQREKEAPVVAALEEASVARKPWALRGEIGAADRPVDSLLDAEFEHDIAAKPGPIPTVETTNALEDLIKNRIYDGLFDDVVRKLPDEYLDAQTRKKVLPDISQEKAGQSLAETYEQDYLQAREAASKERKAKISNEVVAPEVEMSKEHREIETLFNKLNKKLDALTRLRFTPEVPRIKDIDVAKNVKAINREEVLPEGVSDAMVLAPHEVYKVSEMKDKETEGLSKVERKRRRARIKRRKKKIQTRLYGTKAANGGVKEGMVAKNSSGARTGDYSKSNRFFARIASDAQNGIDKRRGRGSNESVDIKRKSAASLKL